jgi:hypothetical protein
MSFEARLYIQGVSVYVPHPERPEVLVLFPDQERANQRGLRDLKGEKICHHQAAVQFSSRYLENAATSRLPDAWTTMDISGMWVGFSTDSTVAPRLTRDDGRVAGVPYLPEALSLIKQPALSAAPLDSSLAPQAYTGQTTEAQFLKAGLLLDAGILSPYAEYEGLFRFAGTREDRKYSSVLKLELGPVNHFTLRFRPFGSEEIFQLPLTPPWDELEVWVRHFCDLEKPDPNRILPEPGEADVDFALNYALLRDLEAVLQACGNVLPIPHISTSWARGGPIGLEPRKCMGSGSQSLQFQRPV